ncbi:hypothetical protein QDY65_08540 [Pyrococcus kukulkanii]|uniref:hypothetical protein n=1 Tax=Pyrococcus kukulkanii TaxID=1609559 RepID=UPI0035631E6F
MPFTPFHLGPALLLSYLIPYLDVWTFLIANVIVDFEPFLVLSFNLDLKYGYPVHGFFHTYVGGGIVALILAHAMAFIYKITGRNYDMERLRITALSGVFLHITLDSIMHPDVKPFFPFGFSPLYGATYEFNIYMFCAFSFLAWLILKFFIRSSIEGWE